MHRSRVRLNKSRILPWPCLGLDGFPLKAESGSQWRRQTVHLGNMEDITLENCYLKIRFCSVGVFFNPQPRICFFKKRVREGDRE